MNNQFDVKKVPKFLYLLLGTIVAVVLFAIFVGRPLINDSPAMKTAHKTALEDIRKYDDAIKRQDAIEAEITKNQNEFKIKEKDLFIDAKTSSSDIESYCRKNNIDLASFNLAEPTIDPKSRVSTGGYPVKIVRIGLSYTDTYDKTMSFLKYLEEGSKGCYYVTSCNIAAKDQDKANSDLFNTSLSIELYYYDRTEPAAAQ